MSSKSSCPTECGTQGDILPTDEEHDDLSPKHLPHYSCFKSAANTSGGELEEQIESACGEVEKESEATSCDTKPQKEPEIALSDLSEKEVAEIKRNEQDDEEQTETAIKEDGDEKQESKGIDRSSPLFNIADAKSGGVDYQNSKPFHAEVPAPNSLAAPDTPNGDVFVEGAKQRSQKSHGTKSPAKSPRELLQSVQLPQVASQESYDDHAAA